MGCLTPFYKRAENGEWMTLPCSRCPECKKRRASGWSFRLMKEAEKSESALFVTLTYDTRYVPISKNGFMTLDKKDVQKFMKRLRKLSINKIKYYFCGEYGSQTMRPHYHAIIFNADVNDIERAWALDNKKIGEIHVGKVSEASVGYTLKYISKDGKIPLHVNDDRQKEFSLMSKGLGKSYLSKNMIDWHHLDLKDRCYIPMKGNMKISLPRYYKDKIYSPIQKSIIADHMKDKFVQTYEEMVKELGWDEVNRMEIEVVKFQFDKMYKKKFKPEKL